MGHVAGVKTAEIDIPDSPSITITDKTNTDTDDVTYVVSNLVEGGSLGHEITATYKAVPTIEYVEKMVAGAVDYLGTVSSEGELNAKTPKNAGDFVRVSTAFGEYHAGDLLVCETVTVAEDGTVSDVNWSHIHGEMDWVPNTKDADGYVTKGSG